MSTTSNETTTATYRTATRDAAATATRTAWAVRDCDRRCKPVTQESSGTPHPVLSLSAHGRKPAWLSSGRDAHLLYSSLRPLLLQPIRSRRSSGDGPLLASAALKLENGQLSSGQKGLCGPRSSLRVAGSYSMSPTISFVGCNVAGRRWSARNRARSSSKSNGLTR